MRALLAASSLILLVSLAGCGGDGGGDASDIQNTPWALVSGAEITLSGGIVPSVAFLDGGKASGNSGCNRFMTDYTLDGDSLSFGQIAGTMMACQPPADEIEKAYLAALEKVASWEVDSEQLVLSDADGNELLRYDVASLIGEWQVTGVNTGNAVSSPITGTELTATFGEDGALAGSAGCNGYTSSYEAEGGTISIEPPGSTKKLCSEPEGVMEQEAAFLQALTSATSYNLDGMTATLLDADDTTLVTLAHVSH